jgi:hypothetical protein
MRMVPVESRIQEEGNGSGLSESTRRSLRERNGINSHLKPMFFERFQANKISVVVDEVK